MMRALWTSASGMTAQQYNVDTISNNLSNVNTTGYKKMRAEFEDLIYQTQRTAGTPATELTVVPLPMQVGHGTKVSATQRLFEQMAIDGEGFFRVLQPDGTFAYTRNGEFKVDRDRQLVTNKGLYAFPQVTFPENFIPDSVAISPQGEVSCKIPGQEEAAVIGQIQLYRFVNPAGLNALGDNLFKQSAASGEAIAGLPGSEGMGQIHHKFIEASNVSVQYDCGAACLRIKFEGDSNQRCNAGDCQQLKTVGVGDDRFCSKLWAADFGGKPPGASKSGTFFR